MTSPAQFIYESNAPIVTSDNYFLKIKAHVEYNNNSTDQIQSMINSTSISFFKAMTLFDALSLVENHEGEENRNYHQIVMNEASRNNLSLSNFVVTTIDAVQSETDTTEIKIEVDPELEGRKKKKGLFGKLLGKK
ncbi:MAG: hypothetical protein ACW99A_07325 [Candidatus Kariarchaeaceae archaeon]